ncbi:MAG TPA: aminotransferase class V-fold PLP-dependent enzyme [Gemmatimonadaceae bacterium]
MRIETLAVHAGHETDPTTRAVISPLHLSTTFEREPDGSYREGFVYTRNGNPTRTELERSLTALEGGAACAAFASGQAATWAVFAALGPGDHVIAPADHYHGTGAMLRESFARWGLSTTFVDMTDLHAVRAAVTDSTRLIWIETPSNPLLRITDIAGVVAIARDAGVLTACDNTWSTPVITRPIELGVDLVVHSTTKYLGGHSDVLGGAVVAARDDALFARIRGQQQVGGAVPSPFDCWLLMRGIRTLPWRMRAHTQNAALLAQWLTEQPRITAVHYPGLPSHPGHAVAHAQMAMPGGMLSIEVDGGRDAAMAMAARLRIFTMATSLGGTESLIEHRASVEGPHTRTPEGLLRVSVGLEHPDDLIEDLAQALR